MNKTEYIDRLILASDHARELAMSLDYVSVELSNKYSYSLSSPSDSIEKLGPKEKMKFLGGRLLYRKDLLNVSPARAGELLWVNGLIPEWVNICAVAYSETHTEFEVMYAGHLVKADPKKLWPDYGMAPGNELAPFRVRGPSEAEWQKREN